MLAKIFEFEPFIFVKFPHAQGELKAWILNVLYHSTINQKAVYMTLLLEFAVLIISLVCEIRGYIPWPVSLPFSKYCNQV